MSACLRQRALAKTPDVGNYLPLGLGARGLYNRKGRATKVTGDALVAASARSRTIDLSPIAGLLELVVRECNPDQVWLFGSRARGMAEPESDWDLLVVVPDDTDEGRLDPLFAWQLHTRAKVRADIVLCRTSEFREDKSTPNTLAFEAHHAGVLVYER